MKHPTRARYVMIGGFLGAGKTTCVARLAQQLTAEGLKVGLITNDQGSELVDTAMLRSRGFATEEIPGGCFCCRFNSLVDAANKLTAATRPMCSSPSRSAVAPTWWRRSRIRCAGFMATIFLSRH